MLHIGSFMNKLSSLQVISAQHLPWLEDKPVHKIIRKPPIDLFIEVSIHIPSVGITFGSDNHYQRWYIGYHQKQFQHKGS